MVISSHPTPFSLSAFPMVYLLNDVLQVPQPRRSKLKLCLQGPCDFRILLLRETSFLLNGREEICQLPHCHILSSRKLQTEPLRKKPHGSPFLPRSRADSIACIKEPPKGGWPRVPFHPRSLLLHLLLPPSTLFALFQPR